MAVELDDLDLRIADSRLRDGRATTAQIADRKVGGIILGEVAG